MTVNGEEGTKISGTQKAAILLVTLGEKLGGEILKQLNEEEVKTVSKAIARLEKVTPNVQVCTGVDSERFIQLFISRVQGK